METVTTINADRALTARRVNAYLRCLGVEEQDAMRRLAEHILGAADDGPGSSSGQGRAMDELLHVTETWIGALLRESPDCPRDPLVGWRLRKILQQHPDALLCEPSLQRLDAAATTPTMAVPVSHQAPMPPQSLDYVPATLRSSFWRGAASSLRVVWHRFSGRFARE